MYAVIHKNNKQEPFNYLLQLATTSWKTITIIKLERHSNVVMLQYARLKCDMKKIHEKMRNTEVRAEGELIVMRPTTSIPLQALQYKAFVGCHCSLF